MDQSLEGQRTRHTPWACIELHGKTYTFWLNEAAGTPRLLVEADEPPGDYVPLQLLNGYANGYHDELRGYHIPHLPLAVAKLTAKAFGGTFLDFGPEEDKMPHVF